MGRGLQPFWELFSFRFWPSQSQDVPLDAASNFSNFTTPVGSTDDFLIFIW